MKLKRWFSLAFALTLLAAPTARAQCPRGNCRHRAAQPPRVAYAAPQASSFEGWLNGVRARYGCRPVYYDAGLAGDAAVNNAHQHSRGLGHFHMGSASRQNAGYGSMASVTAAWLNSPAHFSALVDPRVTRYGVAASGVYWTLSLR